jgi:hypothetical protein
LNQLFGSLSEAKVSRGLKTNFRSKFPLRKKAREAAEDGNKQKKTFPLTGKSPTEILSGQVSEETGRWLLRHRLEALHADLDPLGRAGHGGLDGAQVREEYALIDIVRVRDGVARGGVLSAHFACFCHDILLMELLFAKH